MTAPVTLTVYFEGTANTLRPITTQVGVFFERTAALDVTDPAVEPADDETQLKMGFSGCGVTAGVPGTLFAFGLAPQCDEVVRRIERIVPGRPIAVNVLGLSRGGIAALMLAQRLSRLAPATLTLSLALFDPVPGNLVATARFLDLFAAAGVPGVLTTATGVLDVSYAPISRVLALYPHEPLPAFALHAPLLPRYPASASVEEDATLGCHQAALYPTYGVANYAIGAACRLSAHRLERFLAECGTAMHADAGAADLEARCLRDCEAAISAAPKPTCAPSCIS